MDNIIVGIIKINKYIDNNTIQYSDTFIVVFT